jgi:hypothetical protein
MTASRVLATSRWHQGFGVLRPGTREQRVPFQSKEAAERIAARAHEAGFTIVEVFEDSATGGWSYRARKPQPPKQRDGS